MGEDVGDMVRSHAPVTLHQDFASGWTDWTSASLHKMVDDPGAAWRIRVTPRYPHRFYESGSWSTTLQNYQMEFSGQLEKKSLSWAFRAADEKNYYATKIVITKPGPLPNAGLVRYLVMNGRELDRVQMPLPLTLERGGNYRVRMSVQDDRFITYLNGQVISSWSDSGCTAAESDFSRMPTIRSTSPGSAFRNATAYSAGCSRTSR